MRTDWPNADECLNAIGKVNIDDYPEVESCRLAAVDWITQRSTNFHVDPDDDESALEIPEGAYRAAVMLTARLFKRRESAEGVAGFGEFGAVRVSTIDVDIENLLAPYRAWGIA